MILVAALLILMFMQVELAIGAIEYWHHERLGTPPYPIPEYRYCVHASHSLLVYLKLGLGVVADPTLLLMVD